MPSYYSESLYSGGRWLTAAIEAIGGRVEDSAAFVLALRKVKLDDLPRGPVELDEFGNPIENIYVRKTQRVGGELRNVVIHTFGRVSQFWTFAPAEYLREPVYSRRYMSSQPSSRDSR